MSDLTGTPTGTTSNTGSLTGGATAHAVLADGSGATYVTYTPGQSSVLTYSDPTVPAGAVVKRMSIRLAGYAPAGGGPVLSTKIAVTGASKTTKRVIGATSSFAWDAVILTGDYDPDTVVVTLTNTVSTTIVTTAYLIVRIAEQPDYNVVTPTGTLTEENMPVVSWIPTTDPDPDAGPQIAATVKIFNAAQYGAGGFDPDTSDSVTETAFFGAETEWQTDVALPDDSYRAYVLVDHYYNSADWEYEAFTVNVTTPAAPTVTVEPDDANSRIKLTIESNTGDETTDAFQIEAERPDGWVQLRTIEGDGRSTDDPAEVWDYEAENGEVTNYRVRAAHQFTALETFSEWTEANGFLDSEWWLKHPTIPAYNVEVRLRSFVGHSRAARHSVQQPLDRGDAVVIADTRGPETGEVSFRCSDDDMRDRIMRLATTHTPVLLTAESGDHERSRWIALGDEQITRLIDKSWSDERDATYAWTEVERPEGDMTSYDNDPETAPIVVI